MFKKFSPALLFWTGLFALTLIVAVPAHAQEAGYDNLIVPGDRVGPVRMGGSVNEIVAHIGRPNRTERSTFRGPGYTADEVYYTYRGSICLRFTWTDEGLDPKVESGLRGIHATCDRWRTQQGLRVGSSVQEVIGALGEPSRIFGNCDGRDDCVLWYSSGIVFVTRSRNRPINDIYVVPPGVH